MRYGLPTLLAMLGLAWYAGSAQAAPGDLDPTFGTGGKLVSAPGVTEGFFNDVAIQPDGKIVAVGDAIVGGRTEISVTRFNANGSPDGSFGTGGTTLVDYTPNGGARNNTANAVALQADGKILAAGSSANVGSTFTNAIVVRLTSGGDLDPTFQDQNSGVAGAATPVAGVINDLAVQPDGKIVFGGVFHTFPPNDGKGNFTFGRLNSDGNGDNTFNPGTPPDEPPSDGDVIDFGDDDVAFALALQSDGPIVLAGHTGDNTNSDVAVARYIPGTGPDAGFGSGGKFTYNYGTDTRDEGTGVAVQPDGKIDVAGGGSAQQDFALSRLTSSGAPDNSLDGASTVGADFGAQDEADGLALQANGKMVLAGNGGSPSSFAIARFQPGGAPDETFGPGGKRTVTFANGESFAFAVALQPDGRIVLVGETLPGDNPIPAAARLEGDAPSAGGSPAPEPGSGTTGPNPGTTGPASSPSLSVPRCGGRAATIVGTSGNDRLKGTKRTDVIAGLAGNDRISGLGANDVICGGSGNDKLLGGSGKDRLFGNNGKDLLSGGSGNDTLAGGAGRDSLDGGAGRDRLNGNAGKDKLNGGPGNDRCAGKDSKRSC